jgi:hypothetical protein
VAAPSRGGSRGGTLFVGIDNYPLLPNVCGFDGGSPYTLTLAAADARRLAHAVSQSRLYRNHETTLLVDKERTATIFAQQSQG